MRAWPPAPSPEPRRQETRREEPEEKLRLAAELRNEVVSVWVDMVLNQQEDVVCIANNIRK
jgi:hypothetical protein